MTHDDLTLTEEIDAIAQATQRRVDSELYPLRARLERLSPVIALACVGQLTIDAFGRISHAQRMDACTAWCDNLTAAVRRSLG